MESKDLIESTKQSASVKLKNKPFANQQTALQKILWAARTRILLWYVAILVFIFLASIPAFRQLLSAQIDQRVRQDLSEKVDVFKSLMSGELLDEGIVELDDPELARQDQRFKQPYSKEELADFFDAYLIRQIPEDDIYILTFVDGEFYKSSPRARPEILKRDSVLMQRWAQQTQPAQGKHFTNDAAIGDVLYILEPVKVGGKSLGVLVVAHTTAGEQAEAIEAVGVVIKVIAGVLLIALVLAWFASGRVLAPLRSLSDATRLIGEADLNQRLEVQGTGQLADLGHSFNEMMDRLESAFISQRNFINDAGHELRTPITIIQGHLELMGDDPIEQQETLTIVMDELERMTRFVNDLILLAKSEHPDFLQPETVELAPFAEELLVKAQALADRRWMLEGTVKGQGFFDRQRITQSVMNLAQNATQFTQVGETISIGLAISKGKLHFWVRDTGEGIAPHDQPRIFDRFARAANSRRRSEGAGLGLSIVKSIVEAHGGEVSVRSQIGQGSTFSIVIPLQVRSKEQ
ncbi:ATP-binding protein [Phormidesmis sp. 146-12]